jgi:hypothetical protein
LNFENLHLTGYKTDISFNCVQICNIDAIPKAIMGLRLLQQVSSKSPANLQQIRCVASKSTASLQHFATNGFIYNILTCRDVADKSVVSPASRQQIRWMWFRTDKSTASLQHAGDLLQTCYRQIRCVANKSAASRQQIASTSTANPFDVV